MVVNFVKEVFILVKIVDLIKKNKLKLFPWISVFDGTLLHPDEDIWKTVAKVVKCIFAKTRHCAVIAAFDSSGSHALGEEGDFTEVFSLLELTHVPVIL